MADADDTQPDFDDAAFTDAADAIWQQKQFAADMMRRPEVRRLISATAGIFREAIDAHIPTEVSPEVSYALQENAFIFSGFRVYHSLREVGLSLLTDDGNIKPLSEFRRDVHRINDKYNHNYLRAEYQHAVGSTLMAARWQQIEADGDQYDLQYRTAGDDHVREDHRLLHGTTLPPSDPFWSKYYPPNGWGCRCTAVQVRRGKFPHTDPTLAMQRGDNCTENAKQQMFRFNPGKELKVFPPKHPYYKAPQQAKPIVARVCDNELRVQSVNDLVRWYKENLPQTEVGKFKAKRFTVNMPDGDDPIFITKKFYEEIINKYRDDELYVPRLAYARKAHLWLEKAQKVTTEDSNDHPDATFEVYQYDDDRKYKVVFKVKCNADGRILHYMRLYTK